MQNWKLTLAYDGTEYHGWQVQPGFRTVQGELQASLARVVGESPLPQGSGRTDAGVHALGQVASFVLASPIPADNLKRALNRILPASIRVLVAEPVEEQFHARYSARAKSYEYRIFRSAVCSPFLVRYVHLCRWPLDPDRLRTAAEIVVGEHDFRSFAATDPELQERNQGEQIPPPLSTVRTIFASEWRMESAELLVYRVRGNGFLHHMVRNLVGTMLEIGRGHFTAAAMAEILARRSRAAAGPTAPACGLFLHSVEYDEPEAEREMEQLG
jgi:tRNA pseudouridine38-40 synthase